MKNIHYLDMRRPHGRYFQHEHMRGQVEQYPVICAVDFVEQHVTMRSKASQVVTTDKSRVTCRDCRGRL